MNSEVLSITMPGEMSGTIGQLVGYTQATPRQQIQSALRDYDNPGHGDGTVFRFVADSGIPAELFIGVDGSPTRRCPCNGGLRVKEYPSSHHAEMETRRLTAAMALKHAVHSTGFNGGKLVLNAALTADKTHLMEMVASALQSLWGLVYTGCDLNTTMHDMEQLASRIPYVLASIGSRVCATECTARGLFGSIQAVCDHLWGGGIRNLRFSVVGCGKVGASVARILSEVGGSVTTFDLRHERADLPGCRNRSQELWAEYKCDVLVPCADSYIIDAEALKKLSCQVVVGATNLPFADATCRHLACSNGIVFIPEAVSSAGAVICDSIEYSWPEAFKSAKPERIYEFVRQCVYEKTMDLLLAAAESGETPFGALPMVIPDHRFETVGDYYVMRWKGEPEA